MRLFSNAEILQLRGVADITPLENADAIRREISALRSTAEIIHRFFIAPLPKIVPPGRPLIAERKGYFLAALRLFHG